MNILRLVIILTSLNSYSYTNKNLAELSIGSYMSEESNNEFVIRRKVGNQLEVAYQLGQLSGSALTKCQERSIDQIIECESRNGPHSFSFILYSNEEKADVFINNKRMEEDFSKNQSYMLSL